MNSHQGFETAADALDFIKGGKATITISSAKTDTHFTFKINQKIEDGDEAAENPKKTPFFVSVLNGPDNWENYQYIGYIKADGNSCLLDGKKGHPDAPSFKAFSWVWAHLNRGNIPADLTIQHEGKCCVCGRKLTTPESVASGIGPVCAEGGF
tara:strand:+ start:34407 stop:34865 length:459 start_codon:yes stop_codon:yes gene_type:complete